jgi:predicted DCC family thiol-disulfide oxidoreductase YuxK
MSRHFHTGVMPTQLSPALVAASLVRRAGAILTGYFGEPTHPFNLAVVRILVFVVCLAAFDWDQLLFFSGLPSILLFPPHSLLWLVPHIPINPQLAGFSAVVYLSGCILGLFGLFTRWAALAVVASGLYALGIPNLYGKVNNYNHALWFAAVLAFSPCSDAFSLDAVRRGWAAADRNEVVRSTPSVAYALPIRFIWVLLGIIYFFPGLWKLRSAGLDWALGPPFLSILYQKWFELGWWTPVFRIDQFPLLLKATGLATMLWELTFVLLIFPKTTRPFAVVTGTLFHWMTRVFMQIFLWDLNLMYLSFFDLSRLNRWAGKKIFPNVMYVVYDGNCSFCRRAMASLRVVDILERIEYVSNTDLAALQQAGLSQHDQERLHADIHAVVGARVWQGFDAYRAIATRVPILWILVPLSYLPPVAWSGRAVYRRRADSRSCRIETAAPTALASTTHVGGSSRMVVAIGTTLIVLNALAGWFDVVSWPFSVYPTFMCCVASNATVITMEATGADGRVESVIIGQADPSLPIGSERLSPLVVRVATMDDAARQQDALRALLAIYGKYKPSISTASAVSFYKDEFATAPGDKGNPSVRHQLLFQLVT